MAVALATDVRNDMLDAIIAQIDAGTGAGKIRIYDGVRPASGGAATTLLAELVCTDPSAGAAAAGTVNLSAIADDASADATGTATWFRIVDSDNVFVMDGDVGTAGSDLNLNSTAITIGGTVSITAFTLNAPNA